MKMSYDAVIGSSSSWVSAASIKWTLAMLSDSSEVLDCSPRLTGHYEVICTSIGLGIQSQAPAATRRKICCDLGVGLLAIFSTFFFVLLSALERSLSRGTGRITSCQDFS